MGRPKSNNVQVNISTPVEWKKELENFARIYSAEEGETITFLDLMRRGIQEKYHSTSHCKYLTQYQQCNDYNYHIKALEVMPDHIHIFVDVPQTVAPCDVVRTLKSISAIELFKVYPQPKGLYAGCGALWAGGYFVSTVERISESTVVKYIEELKND